VVDRPDFEKQILLGDADLVITDFQLHWTDGLQIISEAKTRLPDVPIVMLTGTGTQETGAQAIKLGAADYVLKHEDNWPRVLVAAKNAIDRAEQLGRLRETEKLVMIGRLTTAVMREIATPLESLRANLSVLEKHPNHPEASAIIKRALKELDHITEISEGTLGLYRESPNPVQMRFSAVLDEVCAVYQSRIAYQRVQVLRNYSDPLVLAYPNDMRQVFSTLISNALDVMLLGGQLELSASNFAREGKESVNIRICDTGPGIPKEYTEKIFDPLFTTKGEKGTGLGLWLAKEIVTRRGGTIHVNSSVVPGTNGSCFTIQMPATSLQAKTAS
jgi:signal transduction histidine kinase